jgi:hypothetical protein
MTVLVTLRGVFVNPLTVHLERTPIYLRFVYRDDEPGKLDALDQLDDQAQPGETIIAAKMDGGPGWIHVDGTRAGRRYGETRHFADYLPLRCQLTQEQLADNEQWGQWVDAEVAKVKP